MARKHHKPEEIVAKLRQVEVLVRQGKPVAEGVRAIGVTKATYYRWRAEYGGLKLDQVRRLTNGGSGGRTDTGGCPPSPSRPGSCRATRARCRCTAPAGAAIPWD